MKHLVPVQAWLPQEIAEQVKAHCRKNSQPVSEFIRALVVEACAMGLEANYIESHLEWISSNLNFASVALDALLGGHADAGLRERVHEAFALKEERRLGSFQRSEGAAK